MTACKKLIESIVTISEDKKASNISTFHIEDEGWLTEYVVVVSVLNNIQGKAVTQALLGELKPILQALDSDEFYEEIKTSGSMDSGWIILDFNSVLVHCVTEQVREFYALDALFEKYGLVFHYK